MIAKYVIAEGKHKAILAKFYRYMVSKSKYNRDVVGSNTIINKLASHAPTYKKKGQVVPTWK